CLACAGFSTADQVLAAEDYRYSLLLNRGWFGVSERLTAPHLSGCQSQLRKIHKLLLISSLRIPCAGVITPMRLLIRSQRGCLGKKEGSDKTNAWALTKARHCWPT